MELRRSAHRREKSVASHRSAGASKRSRAHGAFAEANTLNRPKLTMRCSQGAKPSRRVRPPFRLAVQKDGRWPRAGAARERRVRSARSNTKRHVVVQSFRQRHAALKCSISWVSRMPPIKEPGRLFRIPWVRPLPRAGRYFHHLGSHRWRVRTQVALLLPRTWALQYHQSNR
jgi:hypothetical protein